MICVVISMANFPEYLHLSIIIIICYALHFRLMKLIYHTTIRNRSEGIFALWGSLQTILSSDCAASHSTPSLDKQLVSAANIRTFCHAERLVAHEERGDGTVASIVSCRGACCCWEPMHWKIFRQCSLQFAEVFFTAWELRMCEPSNRLLGV